MRFLSSASVLIKSRLSLAVTLSAAAGYFLFAGRAEQHLLILIGGVFFLAGGAAALNQVQEHTQDARMDRTKKRPIPSGTLTLSAATGISAVFCLTGTALLMLTGFTPALLGLATLLIYNGLYTNLKARTSFAVIPGGLVGALPPMIGWAAAGGPFLHPKILFVATLLFLWQVPHFWLLAIRYGSEYEAAGFATIQRKLTDNQIRRLVFWWLLLTLGFLFTTPLFGIKIPGGILTSMIILATALTGFFYMALFRKSSSGILRWAFILTNLFLVLVLAILIFVSLN